MDLMDVFGERIKIINRKIDEFLRVKEPERLYDATRYLPLSGGKRLRPLLVSLSTEVLGEDWKKSIPFGIAIELMHNFTLVHDDIMDRSPLRRNIETTHVKFGEETAIIAGDLLFAKSYEALHELDVDRGDFRRLNLLLTKCIEEICEGQYMDMDFEKRDDVTEDEYMKMIEKKTAALFSCSAEGGAIIGGGSDEEIKALSMYGKLLGLGFQIWDDYLDLKGKENEFGKRIGNDIREGKKTLMIIHALARADEGERDLILSTLGKKDAKEEEIKDVIEILDNLGSLSYAKEKAREYTSKAKGFLGILPKNDARRYLEELVDYAISRRR